MSIRQRQLVHTMATELINILNNMDDLPSLQNATPEQLQTISTMSRKRFCLMYFKSFCIEAIVLILGLLSYNIENTFSLIDKTIFPNQTHH